MDRSKGVSFSDHVHVNEIPKVEIELIPELFYSKFDYRRFKSEEKFREERAVARAIRRLVGHAVTEMEHRLGSCEDVQNTEKELITQSRSQSAGRSSLGKIADAAAISSDEDSEEDIDAVVRGQMHVKPLAIREERVKARRRTSLLSMPSYKSHAFEDENMGSRLDDSFNFIDRTDMTFQDQTPNLSDLSVLNGSDSSIDLTFTPVEFNTVIDEISGRPSISQ